MGKGAARFCQIVFIKKTELAQIRPQNTYRVVIKNISVHICGGGGGSTQIQSILRGGDPESANSQWRHRHFADKI